MWTVRYWTKRSGIERTVDFRTASAEEFARKRYKVECENGLCRRVHLIHNAEQVASWDMED